MVSWCFKPSKLQRFISGLNPDQGYHKREDTWRMIWPSWNLLTTIPWENDHIHHQCPTPCDQSCVCALIFCVCIRNGYTIGGFLLACEDFGRMFDHSFPVCTFFFFFWSGDWLAHTNSTLYAMINPWWLSWLRWLWVNALWQVVCELISRQVPTLCLDRGLVSPLQLLSGQGCMCI